MPKTSAYIDASPISCLSFDGLCHDNHSWITVNNKELKNQTSLDSKLGKKLHINVVVKLRLKLLDGKFRLGTYIPSIIAQFIWTAKVCDT